MLIKELSITTEPSWHIKLIITRTNQQTENPVLGIRPELCPTLLQIKYTRFKKIKILYSFWLIETLLQNMVKIIIHLSSQNGFENYYRSLKDRKDTVFTVNTDSTPPKCWWHQKYIIIHLIILSSELPWEKKENLGFQLYKNAGHFVLHVWRLQPMILNLIRRKISKRG